MNKKLDSFSKCHIENTSCQPNNEKKNFETLQDSVKFLQEELAAKKRCNETFNGNSNSYTRLYVIIMSRRISD